MRTVQIVLMLGLLGLGSVSYSQPTVQTASCSNLIAHDNNARKDIVC